MYRSLLILFLFIFCNINAQVNTQLLPNSSWIMVKLRMLDGSRDLTYFEPSFLLWKFKENKLYEYSHPVFRQGIGEIDIKLERGVIRTSKEAGYQIEKLTSDSLVVILRVNGIDAPDKVRKMWFVNKSFIENDFKSKIKNDSTVTAIKNFTPTLERNVFSDINDKYVQQERTHDFNLKGNIEFFPKKKRIKITINNKKEESKDNQSSIDYFKTTLEQSYHLWDLTGFGHYDKVVIAYEYFSKMWKGKSNLDAHDIILFDSDYTGMAQNFIINVKDKRASIENFNKGVSATNSQKFDKAIEFFIKAHEYDNTNTDSLYNAQSILLAQNNVSDACIVLKRLKDLEQTEGTKLYKEKCSEK